MSEWWSYRPSDLLLFSAQTYDRLVMQYNADLWPAQVAACVLGVALGVLLLRPGGHGPRIAWCVLAAAWLWVAVGFHQMRYAPINWAASWFALAFAVQAALCLGMAATGTIAAHASPQGVRRFAGVGLLAVAVIGLPLLAPLTGQPWARAEVFGLMPDPTVMATLGALLLMPGMRARAPDATGGAPRGWRMILSAALWPIPVLWCLVSAATTSAMQAPLPWLMPGAAALAIVVASTRPR